MKAIIKTKAAVATDTCMFELASADGARLPAFEAGAHIDVHVGGMVRQYSLCNSPADAALYRIGVLRDPASRGGSVAMHGLSVGATLEISAPKNHFPLAPDAKHSVLIAGGIGITPLLCMAEALALQGASFELHYCVRSQDRAAFRPRLDELKQTGAPITIHVDEDASTPRLQFHELLQAPHANTHLYVCGPTGFISAVLNAAAEAGWSAANVHREYFGNASPAQPAGDRAFKVVLSSTGREIEVGSSQTVVVALREHGIDVPVSCEQGVCGTCLTRVLDGEPDHRDLYLTDEERAANDQFLPCCSRAKSSKLVLDL